MSSADPAEDKAKEKPADEDQANLKPSSHSELIDLDYFDWNEIQQVSSALFSPSANEIGGNPPIGSDASVSSEFPSLPGNWISQNPLLGSGNIAEIILQPVSSIFPQLGNVMSHNLPLSSDEVGHEPLLMKLVTSGFPSLPGNETSRNLPPSSDESARPQEMINEIAAARAEASAARAEASAARAEASAALAEASAARAEASAALAEALRLQADTIRMQGETIAAQARVIKSLEDEQSPSNVLAGMIANQVASGEKVHTNYRLIEVGGKGDGRCMFRALVLSGQFIRLGRPCPDENEEEVLADDLRNQVCDEYVRRREEVLTMGLVEGNFDEYVTRLRSSNAWGGDPDLYVAAHRLRTQIIVYVNHRDGVIPLFNYGRGYGGDAIRLWYNGVSHYCALELRSESHSTPAKSLRR